MFVHELTFYSNIVCIWNFPTYITNLLDKPFRELEGVVYYDL